MANGTLLTDSVIKGVDISLNDIALQGNSKAYGLYVDVSSSGNDSDSSSRYAAIFNGGSVGIGPTN